MAFWGIEVKPGKPFTQEFNESKGRLHVSLATLGFGTAVKKCILQCNVGNKSPVYLCSLFPEKTECLQLNLEFEEADDIVFSVIGPRSIHLSGYFLGSYRRSFLDDNSYPILFPAIFMTGMAFFLFLTPYSVTASNAFYLFEGSF